MMLSKLNPINWIKLFFYNRKMLTVQQFAHKHRSYLVIVCDPKDDTIFVSYKDKHISAKIKSVDGKNHHVVKRVLKHSYFKTEIDRFLGGLIDALKCSLPDGINFYQFIDGALYNITKALKRK